MRLIIDGNSLLNAALLRGVDHDNGRLEKDEDGKTVQVNSAQYGVDNFFDKVKGALDHFGAAPRQCILVWDGKNAKARRRTFLERYKEGRDKHPAQSEQLNIAREKVTQMMRDLGATVVFQDGLEADDVIAYLVKHLRVSRNVVITSDGDLSVLVDENTDVWRLGELNKNPYGMFPHKFITLYKALVGDTSDKIPGAKGFGDAAFVKLVRIFGLEGLAVFQELIETDQLHRLKEDVADMPELQKVIDAKDMVAISWRVARLHVEAVNTRKKPWTLMAGMVKQWSELAPEDRVHDLREFYGTKTLVHAGNYDAVFDRFKRAVQHSPFVAMDIEASTPPESDEWIAKLMAISEKSTTEKIDVLGATLTGMGITFGDNTQHTIYMTVDHAETDTIKNITKDQCRELCEQIPHKRLHTVIHNRAYEFPVLYQEWGDKWKDNGWAGFWPNAVDSLQSASYTNENLPLALKDRSLAELGYKQQTYEEVTTIGDRRYKMNELPAEHVLNYGADDPICTAALFTFHQIIMEVEDTWRTYLAIEQKPEYLTSLAFVQGFPVSLEKLVGMEKKDDQRFEEAWRTLREYLMGHGWTGTVCPQFEEITPAAVKEAVAICVENGTEFTTKKRKLDAMAYDIREQFPDSQTALLIADAVEKNMVNLLNGLVKTNFTGDPVINFDSPVQVKALLYDVIGIRPRLLIKMTEKQRKDPVMSEAFRKRRKEKQGKVVTYTPEEVAALKSKAAGDDTAIDLALALDTDLTDQQRSILKALQAVKTVMTRRKLFYKQYKVLPHWKDGKIHPHLNQSRAVTRRYSASNPNVQQLPKRGEGYEFRQIVLPFRKNAVVASLDFSGQELRLMAHMSGDENLTACYVGDNLKDVHSLTAVAAAPLMWNGETVTYERFQEMRKLPKEHPDQIRAKKLREDAKTTNFATQYDAQAETVSKSLLVEPETAQLFIDAKDAAFPGIGPWKDSIRETVEECGYAVTLMGARRHLADVLNSDNSWEAQRAGRQGPNFYIQGSAGEQTKQAMSLVWDSGVFTDGRYNCQFYFPVHDELVFSAVPEHALEVTRIVHSCMTAPYGGMTVPIVSSISLGPSYGSQIECGDEFDAAAITAAIEETCGVVA
jgi:5'-3' exonuclease